MLKRLGLSIAAALLLTGITGCGGGKGGTQPSGAGYETAGSDVNVEKVTIKLMQFKHEITDKVKAMAADYMAENPNVILEVKVTSDYEMHLRTLFASGDPPDIFMLNDISEWSERLADLSNEPWISSVSPSAVPGMAVNGKKLGFPVAFEGYGFIYNKDLFAKAGIRRIPTTLTELRQANEKLKAVNIPSYAEGYKEWWILGQHLFNLPFAYESDPAASIDKINKGEMKVNDIAKMNGFFDVLDMTVQYGKGTESVGISYDNQVADFSAGKTAMMQQGVWTIDSIRKLNPDIKMGMFAIPLSDNAGETKLPVDVPGYYVINKNTKNLDECKKFLTWLHAHGQKYLVDSFLLIPAFTDLNSTPELGPLAADLNVYVENNRTIPWSFTLWPIEAKQEFGKSLQAYVSGVLNKEQTMDEIQKTWYELIKRD